MMQYINKEKVISIIKEKRDAALSRQKCLQKIGDESILNEMIAFNFDKVLDAINDLDFGNEESEHWKDIRERAAIAAMQGMLANPELLDKISLDYRITIERAAIGYANELIEQLKKK